MLTDPNTEKLRVVCSQRTVYCLSWMCATCCTPHCDNFLQLWTLSSYPFLTYDVVTANTLCHAVTLTLTLWHSTPLYMIKLQTKFERNRTFRGRVIMWFKCPFGGRPPCWIWAEVDFHNSAVPDEIYRPIFRAL